MPESDSLLREIVTTLFPPQLSLIMEITTTTAMEDELVTDREILEICKSTKDRKAFGPDGIPNKALKTAIENNVGAFVDIYNSCLTEGTFPPIWKRQRLVLIPKRENQTKIRLLIVPYVCWTQLGKFSNEFWQQVYNRH